MWSFLGKWNWHEVFSLFCNQSILMTDYIFFKYILDLKLCFSQLVSSIGYYLLGIPTSYGKAWDQSDPFPSIFEFYRQIAICRPLTLSGENKSSPLSFPDWGFLAFCYLSSFRSTSPALEIPKGTAVRTGRRVLGFFFLRWGWAIFTPCTSLIELHMYILWFSVSATNVWQSPCFRWGRELMLTSHFYFESIVISVRPCQSQAANTGTVNGNGKFWCIERSSIDLYYLALLLLLLVFFKNSKLWKTCFSVFPASVSSALQFHCWHCVFSFAGPSGSC